MIAAALLTALLAAAIALAWFWRPPGAAEPGARAIAIVFGLLGAWALWFGVWAEPGSEPEWIVLLKPTLLYGVLVAVVLGAPLLGWDYPVKLIFGSYFIFANREWRWINLAFALACVVLGIVNLVIAFGHTRDDWNGFKWSCMVNVVAVFILRVTFVWVDLAARLIRHVNARAKKAAP